MVVDCSETHGTIVVWVVGWSVHTMVPTPQHSTKPITSRGRPRPGPARRGSSPPVRAPTRRQLHRDALARAVRLADEVDAERMVERRVIGMVVIDVGVSMRIQPLWPLALPRAFGLLDDVGTHGRSPEPLDDAFAACAGRDEMLVEEGEHLPPAVRRLLGPVGDAAGVEEGVAGAVVAVEFVRLAEAACSAASVRFTWSAVGFSSSLPKMPSSGSRQLLGEIDRRHRPLGVESAGLSSTTTLPPQQSTTASMSGDACRRRDRRGVRPSRSRSRRPCRWRSAARAGTPSAPPTSPTTWASATPPARAHARATSSGLPGPLRKYRCGAIAA